MQTSFEPFNQFVERYQKFVVTTHVNPDCDALGSAIAMAKMLRGRRKQARVINSDPTPQRFAFADPHREILVFGDEVKPEPDEAVIVVDVGDLKRLGRVGDFLSQNPRPFACVDHHKSNTGFAEVNVLRPDACATGLILADIARDWHTSMDKELASALYLAIYTDTGGFRYANTDAKTLATASDLVNAGADPSYLATQFHENIPVGRVQLFCRVLDNLHYEEDGQVVWVAVSLDEMNRYGCDRSDIEGFVEYIRGIESIEVAVLFRESDPGKTKLSFRSRNEIDCSLLAGRFGGGGHLHAAGANLDVPLDEAIQVVLPHVREVVARKAEA
ncbi:MAG: bifunctional oligoribonuclease/PAP phosphatase NrnA [Candidatus Omnitrophica bacterium]|nr:bifunctional oligoribonuclease/PAP phosphatase NrnA [bacterium]MBK7497292.1 bifunctional oligoribonuclease/PAP phosphatase NrnA [Candidatus Omnitrophota bacterium]MCE7907221.1 bifunctional oligoribonuclease/PAP phosphatase NrnA [Candidatus Omnitrophica bacterium COP1]MBV6482087.1 Bifunctional oligoribonuclease and PAP phosphatase NrnA [bacterium]MBW7939094.1 bifunctional oligoribonuclease/PAP phosphatase NrnA [Candidatus Omnitrophota bacterium]